jgi:hypothetical protein
MPPKPAGPEAEAFHTEEESSQELDLATAIGAKELARDWMTRKEAATTLGVSERQVQRRAEQGYLRVKILPRRLHEKSHTTMYNRADIAAIAAGSPNKYSVLMNSPEDAPEPAPEPKKALSTALAAPAADQFAGLPAFLANLSQAVHAINATYAPPAPASPPPPVKPWLTLNEAAEFSGLPKAYLRSCAEIKAVRAISTSGGRFRNWRFHRDSLTTFDLDQASTLDFSDPD